MHPPSVPGGGEDRLSSLDLLRWYATLFRGDVPRISLGLGLSLVQSLVLVPVPLLLRQILDHDIPEQDVRGIVAVGAAGLGLYLLYALMTFASGALTLMATKRVTEMLRARLCTQLQQLSLRFHDREKASELHARVVLDTERIDVMGNALISHAMSSGVMAVLASALLAWLNWKLFLVTLAMIPVYILVHVLTKPRMREVHRDFREGMEGMSSLVNDLLRAIRLVKAFAREEHEQARAERQFQSVTRRALAMTIFTGFYGSLMTFLANATTLLLYVAGGMLIIRESMTVGDLVAFASMVGFLVNPLNTLMNTLTPVFSGLASLAPVHRLLLFNDPREVDEGKTTLASLRVPLTFENVSFWYETPERAALREINLTIRPGETVALVGESGAGKSTLASLVLGLYLPALGRLLLGASDIRDVNLRALRERIGVVAQDNVLLNTSIRENLLYGRLDATEEQIRRALADAHALGFVEAIPGGLGAVVGDRGVKLSGGQRQRLAIARALLKDPDILILDEATSALDSDSEARIQAAFARLRRNRTCLVIAHRLSTVMGADRILVFRRGRIVEEGTHAGLLSRGGEYARLCARQFGRAVEPAGTEPLVKASARDGPGDL